MSRDFFDNLSLPYSSSNEDLETISRNKFSKLFDPALFELRPEIQRDKGIDLTVEIKKNNQYTNFRFAVQLKSTASKKINKDGSISFPVEISNINYLLNYGMPSYYILYEHTTEKFYFEDVYKVYQNLIKKYKSEKLPKEFKIKFSRLFTAEIITEVYKYTLDNGILLRRLNSHLKIFDSKKTQGIVIDNDNEVYSVEQNIAFINQFGFELINNEDFNRIIEIEQRTHPRFDAPAMFNLICGIAYFQRAHLFKALDFLKVAYQNSEEFDPEIQSMLVYTLLNAKYLLGMMTKEDFQEEISKVINTKDVGTFLQLEKAYKEFLNTRKNDVEGIKALYKSIDEIVSKAKNNSSLRTMAYAQILEAESKILINDLINNYLLICGRVPDPLKTNTYKQWLKLEKIYTKRLRAVFDFAFKQENYLGMTNLGMTNIRWVYSKIHLTHVFRSFNRKTFAIDKSLTNEDLDILMKNIEKLDRLAGSYELLQHKENLVSCLSCLSPLKDWTKFKK